ncbi:hypothetical protein F5879DRAFT_585120 [Lentinula edodes]|nr:uncharacterized protein C8R40DRAFT_133801 [Lentinula edodes]KAF8827175.1 hypothetical protein HHX47_DHR5000515 [Lentinula edodes]KAH7876406.1 hypothetical protein C8R40DRAFT_133801 [Lentinula edodes]KAJ3907023.1 hypothetical protein F5879DRAFT_585120 [Lentinula edodes]
MRYSHMYLVVLLGLFSVTHTMPVPFAYDTGTSHIQATPASGGSVSDIVKSMMKDSPDSDFKVSFYQPRDLITRRGVGSPKQIQAMKQQAATTVHAAVKEYLEQQFGTAKITFQDGEARAYPYAFADFPLAFYATLLSKDRSLQFSGKLWKSGGKHVGKLYPFSSRFNLRGS